MAGTAGRHGYREWRLIPPNESSWSALSSCAAALGMERVDLGHFIRRHYASAGLQSVGNLSTMADLNRVLWGLKAMLRRRGPNTCAWRIHSIMPRWAFDKAHDSAFATIVRSEIKG